MSYSDNAIDCINEAISDLEIISEKLDDNRFNDIVRTLNEAKAQCQSADSECSGYEDDISELESRIEELEAEIEELSPSDGTGRHQTICRTSHFAKQ